MFSLGKIFLFLKARNLLFPTPYLNRETTVVKKLASCTKINSIEKLHLFSFKSHKNMNTQNVDIHIRI